MALTRIVARPGRAGVFVLIAAAVVAGCSKPPRPKATAKGEKPPEPAPAASGPGSPVLSVPSAPSAPALPAPTGDPKADAAAFARAFLKAVHDGTASPAMLTPEFKKVIAEPVFSEDQARGYSDDAAGQWLQRFKGAPVPEVGDPVPVGEAVLLVAGSAGPPRTHVCLRVARAGGSPGIDWYFPAAVDPAVTPVKTGAEAAAGFAAAAFLDALLGKADPLAEGLLTPRYRAEIAPPFGSDKRGYNRGLLATRLAGFRGGATGYRVLHAGGDAVTGELVKGDTKRPFSLKLVPGARPWDRLVDGFGAE